MKRVIASSFTGVPVWQSFPPIYPENFQGSLRISLRKVPIFSIVTVWKSSLPGQETQNFQWNFRGCGRKWKDDSTTVNSFLFLRLLLQQIFQFELLLWAPHLPCLFFPADFRKWSLSWKKCCSDREELGHVKPKFRVELQSLSQLKNTHH